MIDHFVLACRDGEVGQHLLANRLGTSLVAGGRHEGRGTRNHLGSLGDSYIELLSPDPDQSESAPLRETLPENPSLIAWCVRSDELSSIAQSAKRLLLKADGPKDWSRATPNGTLNWRLLFIREHSFHAAMPFFIDWGETPLPSSSAPKVGKLESFSLTCPESDRLNTLLEDTNCSVHALEGEHDMSLTISGLKGSVTFKTSAPFPRGL